MGCNYLGNQALTQIGQHTDWNMAGWVDDEGGDAHRVENVQPGQTNRGEHSGKSDGVADVMMLLELADDGDGNGDGDGIFWW